MYKRSRQRERERKLRFFFGGFRLKIQRLNYTNQHVINVRLHTHLGNMAYYAENQQKQNTVKREQECVCERERQMK